MMHGNSGGFPSGLQGGPGGMELDEDLMKEAREWLGDKVDAMGTGEGGKGGDNPFNQLPKPKTRKINLNPTKRSKLEDGDAIAIVGVGGKFPGADTIDEFWQVLVKGENHVIEIPPERWNVEEFYSADYDEPGKTYVRRAGFLKNFDEFDPKMFGISEPEAAKMDPQQRYILDCVHMALEDGGILRKDLNGSRTGVYIGVMNDDYKSSATEDPAVASNYTLTGTAPSIVAARVSYVYNLLGPSMSIDTACSSALVAIHLASQAIKSGDCAMAICGGVNSILYPDILIPLAKARMVSPIGQCQAFSDTADGYIRGEGGGVVVLKSLKKALEDGNKIWATIATGCNQDGRTMTPITAPSIQMQTELLQEVYEANNVDPDLVQYIEAHGTGTPVGDPIEANSLGEFFNQYRSRDKEPLRIGSVKTNIGHLESAAGVAGLIKVLLMMKHGKTVKTLHFERPNPKIDFPSYNMAVTLGTEEWPTLKDGTRVSCVNSFGFGGTNSHAIIRQFPVQETKKIEDDTKRRYIVFLSALDNGGLANSLRYFAQCLEQSPDSIRSIAYTSSCKREHFKYRLALVAESKEDLRIKAEKELKTVSDVRPPGLNPPNIVFVFCGVGTTWNGMCKQMLRESVFCETVKKIDTLLKPYTEWSILEKLEAMADLSDPLVGHLAIFTCQVGLAELLKYYGIEPKAIIGQSVGEVAAAYASGSLSLEDAVKVIYHRSAILSRAAGGSMFVVGNCNTQMVEDLCNEYGDRINIAVYNSSKSSTVSGDTDVVNEVMEKLKAKSEENNEIFLRTLDVKCAYHSRHTENASIELENTLSGLSCSLPNVKLISTVTGETIDEENPVSASYWKENVRKPVQFQKAVKTSGAANALNVFVEIGPKPVLKAHLSDSFAQGKAISFPTMNVNSELTCFFDTLAEFYKYGITPDMERINPYSDVLSDLPKYIPNRMKSLFEADSTILRRQGRKQMGSSHPFVKRQSDDNTPFKIDISTSSTPYVYEHNVAGNILVPGAFYAEVALEASKHLLAQSPFGLQISVEFLRPLRLSPGSPCEAFVMLKSMEPLKNMSFTIQTGKDIIARGTSAVILEDVRLSLIDLQKIRERCPVRYTKERTYDSLKTLGFSYGEDLQILGNGCKNRTECLVEVTLSELIMKDLSVTNIHPAILDGLLQTLGINFDMLEERPNGQMLPAGFRKLILRRTPEKNMLAYMKLTSFSKDEIFYNLLLLQTDGIVIAEVKDFVIRAIEKSETTNGQYAHKIIWTEVDINNSRKLDLIESIGMKQISDSLSNRTEERMLKNNELDKNRKTSFSSSSSSEKKDREKDYKQHSDDEQSFSSDTPSLEQKDDENSEKDKAGEKTKSRSFIFISRDKQTAASFRAAADTDTDVDITYYVVNEEVNIEEDILNKYFAEKDSDKENCLILATGEIKDCETDGHHLLSELVNDCDILLQILKYMAGKPETHPMYVLTQRTQPVEIASRMNLVGSEVWGLVRSVLREQSFKLYLIDIDPDFQSCIQQVFRILSGNDKKLALPEMAIRNGKIYQNEFVTQPDDERNRMQKLKSIDEQCIIEYRSRLPDSLHDTFYSLQQADADIEEGIVQIRPSEACLHNHVMYPLTFEKAVDALNLWPHENEDGYGVLTFEIIGTKVDRKSNNDTYVACYPMKIQSVVNIPKSCIVRRADISSYMPGMLRNTSMMWELVAKLPSKKTYCILTDNDHLLSATILKELITTKRFGQVMVFKLEELLSPEQCGDIIIPFTKIDLQTIHNILETYRSIQMIASLRYFVPLSVDRYVTARYSHVKVITMDVDDVLAKGKLPQIVPSVIKWLKKHKRVFVMPEQAKAKPSEAVYGLPSQVVDVSILTDFKECKHEVRIPENLIFRKTAVYIIIGGMTGLGWEITKCLAEKGAGFIVSLSRREPPKEKLTEIKVLSNMLGCYITTASTDITDLASLQATFDGILTEMPYPIKGIFQGAGVLDDALFVSMTKEKLLKVLTPKVLGTWNLHLVSQNLNLDYFLMHSSMTSVFGNAGQTNYGAANAFLDTFAHYRRNMGLAGQSINWGPLKVGMLNENLEDILKRRGLFPLSVSTIRKCFIEVLKNNCPQITYGSFNWDVIASGLESEEMFLVQYRFRGFVDKILEQKRANRNAVQLNFDLNEIMSITREERMEAIVKALKILASEVFGVEMSLLNEDTLISSLGVDSMLAMTFAQTVLKVMHVKISLVMLLSDGTTIMTLAEAVNGILENGGGETQIKKKEIDPNVYNSMTPYEKRAYNGHVRDKYDPSLYMFGDVIVDSVIAMPKYWKPLIEKIHKKYRALRTLFVPGHDDIRYGVKRVILDPENIEIDFRIVPKSLLQHKTRHPPNIDDYLFDPAKDLPMRVFYAKKGRGAILRFLFNHLALDLNSISKIMNDLRPDAPDEDMGEPVDLAVHIERRLLDDETELHEYWRSVIPQNLQPMSLSTTGELATDPNYFEFIRVRIPNNLVHGLKPVLELNKCTLFQFFTTMFEILLHVELHQPTISIMTTVDCRMFFPDLRKEINRFTNRLPLFLELNDSSMQVAEILQRNKIKIMEAIEHGYMPFMDILSDITSHPINEIFRHQIVMEETSKISSLVIANGKRMPLKVKKMQVGNYYNETIFYIWNDEVTKKLDLELGCSTLIIDQNRANNMLNFMVLMIERLVANPGLTLEEMTTYTMTKTVIKDSSVKEEKNKNVFMKQTKKGWDHKVYLELGSDEEKCLKWGHSPKKMSRFVSFSNILDVEMIEINDQKALVLTAKERKYLFKTNEKNIAVQWLMAIRDQIRQHKVTDNGGKFNGGLITNGRMIENGEMVENHNQVKNGHINGNEKIYQNIKMVEHGHMADNQEPDEVTAF